MHRFQLTSISATFLALGAGTSALAHDLGTALPHPHPHPAQFGLPEALVALLLMGGSTILAAAFLARRREGGEVKRLRVRFDR